MTTQPIAPTDSANSATLADQHAIDRLELDYNQTTAQIQTLTDVRFKLLAFVPTISGAAVGLLSHGRSTAELLAVGTLGLVATVGVTVYELRNSQIEDYAVERAKELEARLGFVAIFGSAGTGGPFTERPGRNLRVFGLTVGHDRGLALVYSAAIGGWSYLVAWGVLRSLDLSHAQAVGGAIGAAAALLVLIESLRANGPPKQKVPR